MKPRIRKLSIVLIFISICFLLLFFGSSEQEKPYRETPSPYPVIDTGFRTDTNGYQSIRWIDDNHLITYIESEQGNGLHLYDFTNNSVLLIKSIEKSGQRWCYYKQNLWVSDKPLSSEGFWRYRFVENSNRLNILEAGYSPEARAFSDNMGCISFSQRYKEEPRFYYRLPEFDMDLYRNEQTKEVTWVKGNGATGIFDASPGTFKKYYPHLKKYLFRIPKLNSPKNDGKKRNAFGFVDSDGKLSDVFQFQDLWDETPGYYPTKAGPVLGTIDQRVDYDPDTYYFDSGGYFLVTGPGRYDVIKLMHGTLRRAELSPDGCLLAGNHRKFTARGNVHSKPTLKIIDLCSVNEQPL